MSKKKKKNKKEKVIYYDDNSTIADMSNVTRTGRKRQSPPQAPSSFKEKWKTYWAAVKMMLIPMFLVLAALAALFLLILLFT